jgi:hypothetical protein
MMKKIIKRSFKKCTQEKGNSFANVICQRMKSDPRFELLMPYVNELKTRNTAFELATAEASDGGKVLTRIKNDCYTAVMEQLDDVADQVEFLAKGDELVALAAGFELIQAAKSINDITMPLNVIVENDNEHTGVAIVKYKADKNAVNTGVESQKVGETTWQNGTFSTSNMATLTGLEAGAYYNVRLYSNGRKGLQSDKTEPVMVLVS